MVWNIVGTHGISISFTLLERNVTDGYPVASDDGLGAESNQIPSVISGLDLFMILLVWGIGFIILPFILELKRVDDFFWMKGGGEFVDCFSRFDVEMNLPLIVLLTQRSNVHFTSFAANTNIRQQFHKLNANNLDCMNTEMFLLCNHACRC